MDLDATTASGQAALRSLHTQRQTKAMQTLMGMVTAMVCDEQLHDREISLLATWLTDNAEVSAQWPACAIAAQLQTILADGIVTDDERTHLLAVLSGMANTDFASTGSASAEPIRLPIDDSVVVAWLDAGVVLTGEFMYGTRAACERLTQGLGARALDAVSKKADILVIGTRVSPHWLNTSYGRKIMMAAALQSKGHPIKIVSERLWLSAAQAARTA